jgi:hypothetical protein
MWMEMKAHAKGTVLESMNRIEVEEYEHQKYLQRKTIDTKVFDAVKKATK